MDVKARIVGLVLIGIGASIAMNIRREAEAIRRYYQSIPEGRWSPRWLRWQWRLSQQQALVAAWLFVALALTVGAVALLSGIR